VRSSFKHQLNRHDAVPIVSKRPRCPCLTIWQSTHNRFGCLAYEATKMDTGAEPSYREGNRGSCGPLALKSTFARTMPKQSAGQAACRRDTRLSFGPGADRMMLTGGVLFGRAVPEARPCERSPHVSHGCFTISQFVGPGRGERQSPNQFQRSDRIKLFHVASRGSGPLAFNSKGRCGLLGAGPFAEKLR
jgi:hypothetical protein